MPLILDTDLFKKARDYATTKNLDFFDYRAESYQGLLLEATEGKIKKLNSPLVQGFGFRALKKGAWGFAITSTLKLDALQKAIDKASTLAQLASERVKESFQIRDQKSQEATVDLGGAESKDEGIDAKISKVLEVNVGTKRMDKRIRNVKTTFVEKDLSQCVGNCFGTLISMKVPTFRFFNMVYAKEGTVLQEAYKTEGMIGRWGDVKEWDTFCTKPVEDVVKLLSARPAPAGTFTVIMDPKLTGTFIHEAFGHASEADSIVAKQSVLEGKIGKQVAAPIVSIIDDGTLRNTFGYIPFDDEGTPGHRTSIIKNGILTNYLTDLESSSRLDLSPTGNGRAENAQMMPQVRMTTTILLPGNYTEEELIAEVKQGILAIDWQYGYTDPVKGEFQFKTKGGYLIENGEKKELIRDVALSGQILESLKNITGISKDLMYDPGTCGKGGQSVRVGDGAPFTRLEQVKVGGMN